MRLQPTGTRPPTPSPEHRTVSRVMSILEVVVASEPNGLRLADLSDTLGAPKSSLHGLARGLVATGYLREYRGRYYRGPAVAMLTLDGQQIPAAYHHALQTLSSTLNETALLATLAGDSVINLDIVEPQQTIRASPPLHKRRPLWPNSSGKVFLAYMDPHRRDRYLNRHHKDPTQQQHIRTELQTIHTTAIAYNRGETTPDLYGIATPITITGTDTTLTLAIAGPTTRLHNQLQTIATTLKTTAQELSVFG